ncbi:MAG TPA: bifunctional 4-hydroxy-3-methylbut-2-enyl diphosphate reductase/30S ribosomal protein S1 [Tissierellaceae bacterium]|nr:bifunctional 4-hydroxy-3-methylbut-2-enyl diphosphate reductase/30S ribosomal protein S1 [Tissierellaceae bacterium]
MKIILAEHSGFCFGVKRAVNKTISELKSDSNKLYSYGPLIHNPQEVNRLEDEGLITLDDYRSIDDGRIIIRSHGVPKNQESDMISRGLVVIDSTCPYVKAVHKKVEDYSLKGYNIIIIGDKNHPEVIGISGYSQNDLYIVNSIEDVSQLPYMDKICLVSQTTNTKEMFDTLSEAIREKANEVLVFNTICNASKNRQDATREVAKMVEAMIVIGGYSSSNTKKLVEISEEYCENVYHIESIRNLTLQELSKFNTIGITAGASTPDWIIKEAIETMDNVNNNEMNEEIMNVIEEVNEEIIEEVNEEANEEVNEEALDLNEVEVDEQNEDFNNDEMNDQMMEAIDNTFTRIRTGDVIKGKVIFVTNNEVMVNINYKSDGIITRDELSYDFDVNPKDLYKEGDEIDVYVLRHDDGEGNVVLSIKRVDEIKNWDYLEEKFNNEETVEATVEKVVKGGVIAIVKGINGFIPASHVSSRYVSDLESFKGQTFDVKIIDFNKEKRRLVLSRKEIEKEELKVKKDALWASLEENKIIEGTVQRLTNFGAFVDLGGVDGLIHISDLAWHRVKHPSEVVNPGDKVEVQVLSFDKEKNRISLGLKQTIEEPWVVFANSVNIGDVVEGEIVNLVEFGAFVRLESGVDGLLHVSQISKEHVNKPSDVLSVGQTIEVKVVDINNEDRKISLSIKEIDNEEEVAEETVEEEATQLEEKADITSEQVETENKDIETTIEDLLNNRE